MRNWEERVHERNKVRPSTGVMQCFQTKWSPKEVPVLFGGPLLKSLDHQLRKTHIVTVNMAPASTVIAKTALGVGAMSHWMMSCTVIGGVKR